MKRFLYVFLCLCLVFVLPGCASEEETPVLQVGYGREDITPDFPMPLQGFPGPQYRIFNRVLDPIYATCIAFSDGENTVLLYTLDLTGGCWEAVAWAKADIQKAIGIPVQNIMVSATHNHSSPSFVESPHLERYVALLREKMLCAAQTAVRDLKPAQMYTGAVEAQGLNAIRHYTLSDGSVCGDNFGDPIGKRYTGHAGTADTMLQVVRFSREGGKDVVLSNWQAHPHITGGEHRQDLSADLIAPMRSYVESTMDCHFAYFTGASGNVNSQSRITGENSAGDYVTHGTELGKYACLAMTQMKPAAVGKVQIQEAPYAPILKGKSTSGPEVELNAITLGDVAFAIVPYEMFSQSGQFIKENSPFQMTFVITCANYDGGYMPSRENYSYNGEESYEATKCFFEIGAAEILAQKYVDLLHQLHQSRNAGSAPAFASAKVYCNADQGTARNANPDGSYNVRFVLDGTPVTLKIRDEETMKAVDLHRFIGLETSGDQVTAVHPLSELSQSLLCMDYCVQSIGGTTVKVNANERLTGKEIVLNLKNIPVLNVSKTAKVPGEPAQLQKGDLISVLCDENGDLLCAYVTVREGTYVPAMRYCEHCEKDVEFLNWFRTTSLPTISGHYFLEGDVTLTATQSIGAQDVTLDLNGFTVTQATTGQGIYWMRDNSNLTLLDTVGTGKMIPASTADNADYTIFKGMCVRMETNAQTLNIYGGTFDGSGITAQHCTTVDNMYGTMNIYGGTFIGGKTYGAGGATLMVQGSTNIYGGTFIGGHCTATDFATDYAKGGGNIYVTVGSILTVYGGTFEGGTSDYCGGLLISHGTIRLMGGTFTGGTAKEKGNTFYCSNRSTLLLDGSFTLTGEVILEQEAVLEIGENCIPRVSRTPNGTLHIH